MQCHEVCQLLDWMLMLLLLRTGSAWELLRENFRGKWQGNTIWYMKNKGNGNGGNMDHHTFIAEMKGSTLPAPALIKNSQYHIYFLDAETGVWRGTGLRFTSGEKVLPLSRKTYTTESNFNFQGMGGQAMLIQTWIVLEPN
jgi:hypothetical protein